jgi:hypothetical protein
MSGMEFTFKVYVDPAFDPESFDRALEIAMDQLKRSHMHIEEFETASKRHYILSMSISQFMLEAEMEPMEPRVPGKGYIKNYYVTSHELQYGELAVDYNSWQPFYNLNNGMFFPRVMAEGVGNNSIAMVNDKIKVMRIHTIDFVRNPEPEYIRTSEHQDIRSDLFYYSSLDGWTLGQFDENGVLTKEVEPHRDDLLRRRMLD